MKEIFGVLLTLIISALVVSTVVIGVGTTYGDLAEFMGMDLSPSSRASHPGNLEKSTVFIKEVNIKRGNKSGCNSFCIRDSPSSYSASDCDDACTLICDGSNKNCLEVSGRVQRVSQNQGTLSLHFTQGDRWKNVSDEWETQAQTDKIEIPFLFASGKGTREFSFYVRNYSDDGSKGNSTINLSVPANSYEIHRVSKERDEFLNCLTPPVDYTPGYNLENCTYEYESRWWNVTELEVKFEHVCSSQDVDNKKMLLRQSTDVCNSCDNTNPACCFNESSGATNCVSTNCTGKGKFLYNCSVSR